MFGIGGWELLVIAVVALIILGPRKLPAAARAIGRVASELRRATSDLRQSIELDPQLKELPRVLDDLNRPILSPGSYPRRRVSRDGSPEGAGIQDPPVVEGTRMSVKRSPDGEIIDESNDESSDLPSDRPPPLAHKEIDRPGAEKEERSSDRDGAAEKGQGGVGHVEDEAKVSVKEKS